MNLKLQSLKVYKNKLSKPKCELEYIPLQLKELLNINYETYRGQLTFEVTQQYRIFIKVEAFYIIQYQYMIPASNGQLIHIPRSLMKIFKDKYQFNTADQINLFAQYFDFEKNSNIKRKFKLINSFFSVLYNISEQIEIDVQEIDSCITIANVFVYVGFQFSFEAEYNALPIGIFDYKKLDSPYNGKKLIQKFLIIWKYLQYMRAKIQMLNTLSLQMLNFKKLDFSVNILVLILSFQSIIIRPQLLKHFDKYFEIQKSVAIVEFTPQQGHPEYSQLLNLQQQIQSIRQQY